MQNLDAKPEVCTGPVSAEAERALIQRVLLGEKELFYALVRPYERMAYLLAYSVLKSEADAEDVTQEAMLKAFRALKAFRGESRFQHWLLKIAVNEARMRYRRRRRVEMKSIDDIGPSEDQDYVPLQLTDWREIPSAALERREVREEIERALELLPEKYREVFMLRDVEQLNGAETAAVLGISEAAMKVRLLRARLRLRDLLAPRLSSMHEGRPRGKAGKRW